jgi:2-oxo-3-hexenedioate decarboxylase
MSETDPASLARELMAAYARGQMLQSPPSARTTGFDLPAAYAVEAEVARLRKEEGHATVGRKVGYANKAVWRVLKLDTLVWAHMYDDTVHYAAEGVASLSLPHPLAPKIEPEIVFKLKTSLTPTDLEPAAVLEAVEWIALGFEIIDCVYPDWKFQPADFVAALGLHVALVVGSPLKVGVENIAELVEGLPRFGVSLLKNGLLVAEGSGKNSLRSPALCLGELAASIARQASAEPLGAGELVSTGTLTESRPIAPGEVWTAHAEGLDVTDLTLRT